ncbi:bifunctional proline dehydrogenase/L-glutamate gamma-semialdehyde dehydrogenase PutA [Xanthobacter variabilis]|uniref:bifunctional proline dehydrogenase/L-glutamate gamma-semialdehyde dehydrogenase PutA n=1 Tax=Xanthobacter variabilis TaxID=3119932 RepID=UPI00372C176B
MTTETLPPAPPLDVFGPFSHFADPVPERSDLRRVITAATRRLEAQCLGPLLQAASLPAGMRADITGTARRLVEALRAKGRGSVVEQLMQEFALSSAEGVALMCLAEALLRIPDAATRDALIRDTVGRGDWQPHLEARGGRPLFVNAAAWGLAVTGQLARAWSEPGLAAALTRLVSRCGAPVVRRAVDVAVGLMGEQFVMGQTIEAAVARARALEARGFLHSYDMLGEAAVTAADAARYLAEYEAAIHAIGKEAAGRGVYGGPGISIKLSALHPRYSRGQAGRVKAELLPRLTALAALAKRYDIGLNIDAEEQDRLELSLDLLQELSFAPQLAGWAGLGFVVQAYGRRCPFVLDWLIDLARRSRRRIMVRLVKGAYWDSEIKRAQVDGLDDFPVFTRKDYTDVSYIACARKLLAARDAVFPQFATHNAQTLATIYHLAGEQFSLGSYEFQCLHGMGEPLYDEVVGPAHLGRPCRIYAPVGSHQTLLAYLVRRLLENGANSSFVHRIADPAVPVDELIADPVARVQAMAEPGTPHPRILAPAALFPGRRNSAGLDLSSEDVLAALADDLAASAQRTWSAAPPSGEGAGREIRNPGDLRELVGSVRDCNPQDIAAAVVVAELAAPGWAAQPVARRVAPLLAAADALQAQMGVLMGLVMREAGKSAADAVAEVREAIDFLRYYAGAARALRADQRALGPVACISPWNFPLAIFTGQVAAALAAGNTVLAKPAEETPLIAAEAVRLLHGAGVPEAVLQMLPGDGRVGAALVASPAVAGVMFTGSTEVARQIARVLSGRLAQGRPPVLLAETGGLNTMIVDSSALAEQAVADVLASAFDSAGQRCSALRVLCVQEEVADGLLELIRGAMAELRVAPTCMLSADVGPVISDAARDAIEAHVARMAAGGHEVFRLPLPPEAAHGTFVAPTLIQIGALSEVQREVFGPVLHVLRYRRRDLPLLMEAINASGYGLTFGLHSRLEAVRDEATARVRAGNIYINRNMIGAVVGAQPFGGRGLSGTGPKAGGPLYLQRLVRGAPDLPVANAGEKPDAAALAFAQWLDSQGLGALAHRARAWAAMAPVGGEMELPGPVGERNRYGLRPCGTVLVSAQSRWGLLLLITAALATGNRVMVDAPTLDFFPETLPGTVAARIAPAGAWPEGSHGGMFDAAIVEGDEAWIAAFAQSLARLEGPVVPLYVLPPQESGGSADVPLAWLMREVAISVNTAAAGGNASLMAAV